MVFLNVAYKTATPSGDDVRPWQTKRSTISSRPFGTVPARVRAAAVSAASLFQQAEGRKIEHDDCHETHYFLLGVFILVTSLLSVFLALVTCCKGRRREVEDGVELRRQLVANRALADKVTTLESKLIDCETSLWISTGGAGVCFHVDSGCVGLREAHGLRQLRACRVCVERGSSNKKRASDSNFKKCS